MRKVTMNDNVLAAKYLKDYAPPVFFIDTVTLTFDIYSELTMVKSELSIRRNRQSINLNAPLILDGENLELRSIKLNGDKLNTSDFKLTPANLTIENVPDEFNLQTEVNIKPHLNTALYGLYKSQDIFCTQCESEGFHHIIYFLDRPDVLAKFTVTIKGDKKELPVLLSNGNLIETGELENGRHFAKWDDPSLKPAYLFALVAGDLDCISNEYKTKSGKKIALNIYSNKGFIQQCDYAMESLKQAMLWDEENYGREYDLDRYMVVAINDFNFGAMENKGLNIFNSKYVLVTPQTATDTDYMGVARVIAHEYFHNWRGDRITCRDWFQISLKEGFTTFCEQEYTAEKFSRISQRINDVKIILEEQFAEDASPMAYPIRPSSYVEINNFYTVTVYNKGAEVIRMLQTLLGKKLFRKATDLFFTKYDGQAVTIEDFIDSAGEVSNFDLTQFLNWYNQAGTVVIKVRGRYDKIKQTFTLYLEQDIEQALSIKNNAPYYIPFSIGLIDKNGKDLPLQISGENADSASNY